LLRGTASSAATVLYNDFEEVAQPGTNVITLDANGAAEVYCDAYCDVTLKNSAGATLRTVTIGNSAPLVEVRSTSFKGTDYDGSPANTVNNPITLKALLDKWITSAGSADWQVLVNGAPTNLQTAVAALAGMFFNVKDPAFGAIGNGVTDDTTAITAAIAAASSAGGGIVFFPPGTYIVSTLTPSVAEVTLMGGGAGSSTIRGNVANTQILKFNNNTVGSAKRLTGLQFSASASYDAILSIEQNQTVQIDHCLFVGDNITVALLQRHDIDGRANITVTDCEFDVASALSAIRNLSDDGESFISVKGCHFLVDVGFTGSIINGPDFACIGNEFDASAVVSGIYYHVDAESNETTGKFLGVFVGNRFIDGGSAGFAFFIDHIENGSVFSESANQFSGFVDPTDIETAGHIYHNDGNSGTLLNCQVVLGSRVGKTLRFTDATQTCTPKAQLMADTIVVTATGTDPSYVIGLTSYDDLPPGARTSFIIINSSGASKVVDFILPLGILVGTTVPNTFKGFADVLQVIETVGSEQPAILSIGHTS
jgi:hypothetical protein